MNGHDIMASIDEASGGNGAVDATAHAQENGRHGKIAAMGS
nr:hypothetical protein [Aminithiophilus ramosus]